MDTLSLIRNTLHERYGIDTAAVTPETSLESLGVDSLGLVELMFEVEDRLNVRLPQDFTTPVTVADLMEIVGNVLNAPMERAA